MRKTLSELRWVRFWAREVAEERIRRVVKGKSGGYGITFKSKVEWSSRVCLVRTHGGAARNARFVVIGTFILSLGQREIF